MVEAGEAPRLVRAVYGALDLFSGSESDLLVWAKRLSDDCSGDALRRARDDEDDLRRGETRHQRGRRERRDADEEQQSMAVKIAQLSAEQQAARFCNGVRNWQARCHIRYSVVRRLRLPFFVGQDRAPQGEM